MVGVSTAVIIEFFLIECDSDPFPCGDNSECINSDGSFSCQCNRMFTGDGITCKGTVFNFPL